MGNFWDDIQNSTIPKPAPNGPLPGMGPTPTLEDSQPVESDQERAKRVQMLRLGLASTITNTGGAAGLGQANAQVATPTLYSPGSTTLLGQ